MKKCLGFSKILIGVFLAIATFVPLSTSYANGSNAWHNMSQWQRNNAIINRAYQDLNSYVGEECKEWVRDVVEGASNGHASIPSNNSSPYNYAWQNDEYNHIVGMSIPIEYVQIGWIVQMRLDGGTPHTAIVAGNNGYGITFIDSNWYYQSAPKTVKTHFLTYAEFYDKIEYSWSYSVYYVL